MKLVVGLGNPGPRYADTRHNVGFRIVTELARRHGIVLDRNRFGGRFGAGRVDGIDVGLLLPETFMNQSGAAVAAAVDALGITAPDLMLVVDDLDMPFGRLRIRHGGGHGGHNGLRDILAELAGEDVPRLRFGVGRPGPGTSAIDHVLGAFTPDECEILPERVGHAVSALECAVVDGVERAMNRFHQRAAPDIDMADATHPENTTVAREPGRQPVKSPKTQTDVAQGTDCGDPHGHGTTE